MFTVAADSRCRSPTSTSARRSGSKEVEVRARVTGILEKRLFAGRRAGEGRADAVRHRSQAARGAGRRAEAELARAQAQQAQAEREVARLKPLAEKHAIGQKEADDAVSNAELAAACGEGRRGEARAKRGSTSATRASSRRSPACRAAPPSPKAASSPPAPTLLTTISQVDPIWVPFNISENEQLRIERAVAGRSSHWPSNDAMTSP